MTLTTTHKGVMAAALIAGAALVGGCRGDRSPTGGAEQAEPGGQAQRGATGQPGAPDETVTGAGEQQANGTREQQLNGQYGAAGEQAQNGNGSQLSASDRRQAEEILGFLHRNNVKEIELGKLAQVRSQNEQIREYGRTLVEEHQKADQRIIEFARENNLTMAKAGQAMTPPGATGQQPSPTAEPRAQEPGQQSGESMAQRQPPGTTGQAQPQDQQPAAGAMLGAEGRQALAKLRGLRGQAFDRQFITMMVQDHQKAVERVRQTEQQVQHEGLKSLLGEIGGSLQEHLEQARELQQQVGVAQTSGEQQERPAQQGRRPPAR